MLASYVHARWALRDLNRRIWPRIFDTQSRFYPGSGHTRDETAGNLGNVDLFEGFLQEAHVHMVWR